MKFSCDNCGKEYSSPFVKDIIKQLHDTNALYDQAKFVIDLYRDWFREREYIMGSYDLPEVENFTVKDKNGTLSTPERESS